MKFRVTWLTPIALLCLLALTLASQAANNRPLIFGMNPTSMELWGDDPAVWDPLLFQKMAAAGCASARIGVNWDQIEPVQGQRDWSGIDAWVKDCLDNNIEPVILINSTPTWALPSNIDPNVSVPQARYPPDDSHIADFNQYVYDLARRFRGRVRYYEFWNEANGYGWYTALTNPPSYGRADLYTPWMIRAYKALKLADPTCEMSTTGIDDSGTGHAADFLNGIYTYGGQGYFDAVADHPYSSGNLDSWKLDQIRSTLDAHGDTDVTVWITEYGYSMDPSQYSTYQGYMQNYFGTLTQDNYSYVRIATWHTANDFPSEAGYGLMDQYLNPKPVYNTFKSYLKPARPVVSNISVTPVSASSVQISYTTGLASTGLVMYGGDTNYGMITARDAASAVTHEATLTGLQPGTLYHFRVRAGAVEDGDAFSADETFTTPPGEAVRMLTGPSVSGITDSTATVTWTTDAASTSTVLYSTDFSYSNAAASPEMAVSHSVTLTGLKSATTYQIRVSSSAPGVAGASVEGTPFTTLSPPGQLINGGFEKDTTGWTYWEVYPWGNGKPDYPGQISARTDNGGAFAPSPATMEGAHRLTDDVGFASAVGGVYQTVTVNNGWYLVSGWVASGTDGGTELIQLIAQDGPYSSGIPSGVNVANLSTTTNWHFYSAPVKVTTGKLTIATRVSQYYATGAVAGHFDGISVTPMEQSSIGSLKGLSSGQTVITDVSKAVTCVLDSNTFYAEQSDRSSGIRVHTASPYSLQPGMTAAFYGTLAVSGGEALIDNATVMTIAPGSQPMPLSMDIPTIGGGTSGIQPGVEPGIGLNNTGLLIRTWGYVTPIDSSSFTLNDGGGSTVKCVAPAGAGLNPAPGLACVVGVSSCEVDGGLTRPVLRLRSASDITAL